jgi:hypothetical protein
MLSNPVLFRAFNIDWTLQYVLFAMSALSFLVGGLAGAYLLKRAGEKRALDDAELQTLGLTPDGNPVRMHWIGAKGIRLEARADLETLRRAAECGDWALFWAWPCGIFSWGCAVGLLATASLDLVFVCVGGGSGFLFAAFGVFMPWAALYTDIDKPKTNPEP